MDLNIEQRYQRFTDRRIYNINHAPLAERKENLANMTQRLADWPEQVAERLSWLLDGSYGSGECLMARDTLELSGRANKPAWLMQQYAMWEFDVTRADCAKWYKGLGVDEQVALTDGINQAILEWLADQDE